MNKSPNKIMTEEGWISGHTKEQRAKRGTSANLPGIYQLSAVTKSKVESIYSTHYTEIPIKGERR